MTTARNIILPFMSIFLLSLFVALVLTAIHVAGFKADCDSAGGTFSLEGGTGWCRY
jgi:hypothetical protein